VGGLVRALLLEAVAAVNRLVAARLERHFGRTSAAAACRAEHLALTAAETAAAAAAAAIAAACSTAGLTSLTAIGAAIWFVLEAFLSIEFLLTGSKCKLCAAIDARK
jgi:hypothetical protein